jgi:hypothetical protein
MEAAAPQELASISSTHSSSYAATAGMQLPDNRALKT